MCACRFGESNKFNVDSIFVNFKLLSTRRQQNKKKKKKRKRFTDPSGEKNENKKTTRRTLGLSSDSFRKSTVSVRATSSECSNLYGDEINRF